MIATAPRITAEIIDIKRACQYCRAADIQNIVRRPALQIEIQGTAGALNIIAGNVQRSHCPGTARRQRAVVGQRRSANIDCPATLNGPRIDQGIAVGAERPAGDINGAVVGIGCQCIDTQRAAVHRHRAAIAERNSAGDRTSTRAGALQHRATVVVEAATDVVAQPRIVYVRKLERPRVVDRPGRVQPHPAITTQLDLARAHRRQIVANHVHLRRRRYIQHRAVADSQRAASTIDLSTAPRRRTA